jgi:hypothetical protein
VSSRGRVEHRDALHAEAAPVGRARARLEGAAAEHHPVEDAELLADVAGHAGVGQRLLEGLRRVGAADENVLAAAEAARLAVGALDLHDPALALDGPAVLAADHPGDVVVAGRGLPHRLHPGQAADEVAAGRELAVVADHEDRVEHAGALAELDAIAEAGREVPDLVQRRLPAALEFDDHAATSVPSGSPRWQAPATRAGELFSDDGPSPTRTAAR